MEFNATFLVAFFSFVIFTIIMNLILYKPISEIVAKRKKYIDTNYENAQRNIDKSVEINKDRENQLDRAKSAAKQNVTEKTNEANARKAEKTSQARAEAQKFVDDTRLYYNNASAEAKKYFQNEIVSLAQSISDKFLAPEEKIEQVDEDIVRDILKG